MRHGSGNLVGCATACEDRLSHDVPKLLHATYTRRHILFVERGVRHQRDAFVEVHRAFSWRSDGSRGCHPTEHSLTRTHDATRAGLQKAHTTFTRGKTTHLRIQFSDARLHLREGSRLFLGGHHPGLGKSRVGSFGARDFALDLGFGPDAKRFPCTVKPLVVAQPLREARIGCARRGVGSGSGGLRLLLEGHAGAPNLALHCALGLADFRFALLRAACTRVCDGRHGTCRHACVARDVLEHP
ncbi:hypothetical protein AB3X91_30610 [Paraburkholderia sp. BR14263]|uniref:hypothetical protein n=1 Tax=unclassified Paraburkholderia TaxID=2615204 RepID=UPI0034CD15CE